MSVRPELSIIIPFFNRKEYLRTSLLSILGAKQPGWEIIAVDDGSTDHGTKEIEDLPVKLVDVVSNRGQAAARNLGLTHASSDLIYFFDSDDVLIPNSLTWLLTQIKGHPDWLAVGGRFAEVIDQHGKKMNGFAVERYCHAPRPEVLTFDYFARGDGISGGLPLFVFRKALLLRAGPLDEKMRCSEDREFLLRILRLSSIPLFDCPLVKRRVHGSNLAVRMNAAGELELKAVVTAMNRLIDLDHGSIG